MPKEQHLPVAFGQPPQSGLKRSDLFGEVERVIRWGHFSGELVGELHFFTARPDDGGLRGMAADTPAVVADKIHENPEKPRLEFPLVVVSSELLDDAKECFLHEVLGELRVSCGPQCVSKQTLPVGVNQHIPGGSFAGLATRQQHRNGTCVHGHPQQNVFSPLILQGIR